MSDHGQAQGETFASRYGEELPAVVARLSRADVAASDHDVEGWGRTQVLVDELGTGSGASGKSMRNASEAMAKHGRDHADEVQPGQQKRKRQAEGDEVFHVFGSGNLGLVYVRGEPTRLTLRELDERYPALVSGLAAHPGVGFVAVLDEDEGPVALGGAGRHVLRTGAVEGVDPLAPFGPLAPGFVLRAALRPEAPDVYVNSLVDPGTEEVAAFEGLVGCHGGLGGWQDRAFALVPRDLPFPTEPVLGADAMHRALVRILRHLGHRQSVDDPPDDDVRPRRTCPQARRTWPPPRRRRSPDPDEAGPGVGRATFERVPAPARRGREGAMGAVIGDLLPLAVGVAISPVPIIAVILMLLAPRAGAASMGFTAGLDRRHRRRHRRGHRARRRRGHRHRQRRWLGDRGLDQAGPGRAAPAGRRPAVAQPSRRG